MQIGDKGTHVTKVQNALNAKVVWGTTPKLVADGIFGANTQNAVKMFQSQKGMTVNGIVDNAVAVKLGLFPSDIVAPVVTTTTKTSSSSSTSTAVSTATGTSTVSAKLQSFYDMMGGKTMAYVGLGVLVLGVALTMVSGKDKKVAEAKKII